MIYIDRKCCRSIHIGTTKASLSGGFTNIFKPA
jgi:hypothetical protein